MPDTDARITIAEHGPYLVSGGVPLSVETLGVDAAGDVWEFETTTSLGAQPKYALCRCGESANKPYCDGAHAKIGFDGTETASRVSLAGQAKIIPGTTMDLADAEPLCAVARFCDGSGSIWKLIEETGTEPIRELVKHQGTRCPSGRLVVTDHRTKTALEPTYDPSLALLEDPQKSCSGPIAVRGAIAVISSDGTEYEIRNRVALCRCGKSSNKPFCDGTHIEVAFKDGL